MSTYRACTVGDRVMLIHDMRDQTVYSELDVEQADILLQQLELAVQKATSMLRQRPIATVLMDAIGSAY